MRFDAAARTELYDLVEKERACCAFLDFEMAETVDGIDLTITVPTNGADSADDLLAPFSQEGLMNSACGCEEKRKPTAAPALVGASIVGGSGALLCAAACTVPFAFAGAGIGGAWLSTVGALEVWRMPILGLTSVVLVVAWVIRRQRGGSLAHLRGLQAATALVLLAGAWGWIEPALLNALT